MRINPAVARTAPPPIPRAQAWAAAYTAAASPAGPLLNLSQGVPSAPPPQVFVDSLQRVIADPTSSKYGAILGETALRQALRDEWKDVYDPRDRWPADDGEALGGDGPGVRARDLGVVCGANMAFMATLQTLCQSGDAILLPQPHYFNQSMTASLLSVDTIDLPCHPPSFIPSVAEARRVLEQDEKEQGKVRCRAVVLVTPNNPTGAVYPPEVIAEFAALAKERDIALIIDETYRDFLTPVSGSNGTLRRGTPHKLFDDEQWRETVISLFSFSKSYCIPGHRLGVICAGSSVLEHVSTVLDCMQINPPRPSQLAIAPVLASLRPSLLSTSQAYAGLLDLFAAQLPKGWTVLSRGAFYAFVEPPRALAGISAQRVAQVLAEKRGVVTLPGEFFMPAGAEVRWLRFAVANISRKEIETLGLRLEGLTPEDFA